MKAKYYLRQVRRVDELINSKLEQIETLGTLATKTTTDLTSSKIQNSGVQDKMAEVVAKIADLKSELLKDVEKLIALKKDVRTQIDSLENPDHRLLLSLRYLSYYSWEAIAVEMGYCYAWVHKIHPAALRSFEEKVDKSR